MEGRKNKSNNDFLFNRAKLDINSALIEYNSLYEYYTETKKSLIKKKLALEEQFNLAIRISVLLDEIFQEPLETQKQKIEEIKDRQIVEGLKINDIFSSIAVNKDNSKIALGYKKTSIDGKSVDPKEGVEKQREVEEFEKIYVKSILSNIIINFESYLEKVLRVLMVNHPERYLGAKEIKISDLLSENIDEILSKTIESELTKLLYDTIDTIDLIETKDKIKVNRYTNITKQFKELYYRRNVFVHNSGMVNQAYLNSVDKEYTKSISIDKELICDDTYIEYAFIILAKIEFTIYYELVNSLGDNYSEMFSTLGDIGFEFLQKEKYEIAEHVYLLLSKSQNLELSEWLMYRINYLNALKQQGKIQADDKEIKRLDVSSSESIYKLGKACLENENEKVYILLKRLIDEKRIEKEEITEWPIFIDFRKTDYYDKIKHEYKELFEEMVFTKETVPEVERNNQEEI